MRHLLPGTSGKCSLLPYPVWSIHVNCSRVQGLARMQIYTDMQMHKGTQTWKHSLYLKGKRPLDLQVTKQVML